MSQELRELFSRLPAPEPPDGLEIRILKRLKEERLFMLRRRRVVLRIPAFGFVVFLFSFFVFAARAVWESGFLPMVSVLLSDGGVVFSGGTDAAFALLESLPAASTAVLLGVLFVGLLGIRLITNHKIIVYGPR